MHPNNALAQSAMECEPEIRATLYRYTRNLADVDEMTQEVYVHILAHTQKKTVSNIKAFSITIARNIAFDWLRHCKVVPIDLVANIEEVEVLDERSDLEETLRAAQDMALLVEAVRQLPDACRQVFVLRKMYGFSQSEIAERLGITINTVEVQLTKGTRRVTEFLGKTAGI